MLRDYEYIAKREADNDLFWKTHEKWYYYDRKNENYVIPTFLLCVVAIFTYPPRVGFMWCVLIIAGALFLCHCNNKKLDNSPYTQEKRRIAREAHEHIEKNKDRIMKDVMSGM